MRKIIYKLTLIIKNYLKQSENYSIKRIIFEFSLLGLATKIFYLIAFLVLTSFALLILLPILVLNPNLDLSSITFPKPSNPLIEKIKVEGTISVNTILDATIFTPLTETLLWQVIPILIVSRFTRSKKWQILISAIIFSLAHVNPIRMILVFPVGLILAWVYLLIKNRSFWKAFIATAIVHAIYNLVALFSIHFLGI